MLKKRLLKKNIRVRDRERRKNWFRMRLNDGPRIGTQYDLFSTTMAGRYEPASPVARQDQALEGAPDLLG